MPTNREFADLANPHSWFLVADNLFEQAVRLREGKPLGLLRLNNAAGRELASWPVENRSVFLLAGFALENTLKAFLVYQNPVFVSNGRLSRVLRSHKLVKLSRRVKQIPWPIRGEVVIREFERGLDSWARYPCALSASESEWEQVLPETHWRQYKRLMQAYGKRLTVLLRRGWVGPYGSGGKWEIRGEFLGAP